jgi:hypothetical protein
MLARLKLQKGDTLYAVETAEGYLLTPYDPHYRRTTPGRTGLHEAVSQYLQSPRQMRSPPRWIAKRALLLVHEEIFGRVRRWPRPAGPGASRLSPRPVPASLRLPSREPDRGLGLRQRWAASTFLPPNSFPLNHLTNPHPPAPVSQKSVHSNSTFFRSFRINRLQGICRILRHGFKI